MLFLRTGPEYMCLHTDNPTQIEAALTELGSVRGQHLTTGLGYAGENDCVVVMTSPYAETVFTVPHSAAAVLTNLITSRAVAAINKVELGPGLILMRIPTVGSTLILQLEEEYQGRKVDLKSGVTIGDSDDTLLGFTVHPMGKSVPTKELEPELLLIHRPARSLFQELRQGAVRYFTEALKEGESEWYELRINIYDAYGNYSLHLARLIEVLEELEVGLILGERWTRDHAFALLSVAAYQVRLFSHWHPLEIKSLLLGLEYNADGRRIVDIDLYYKNQKLNWVQTVKGRGRQSRAAVGAAARDALLARLSPATRKHLSVQEEAAPV